MSVTYRISRRQYTGGDNITEWVTYIDDADYFMVDSDGNLLVYQKDENHQGQVIAAFGRGEWIEIKKHVAEVITYNSAASVYGAGATTGPVQYTTLGLDIE